MGLAVVLFFLWFYRTVYADGTILKCLTQEEDTVRLKCPRRYRIFNPSFVAGVTVNNTCSRSTALCTGMPNTLQNQLANCHWRKQCNVTFRNNDTIQCGQHPDVVERIITFVEIEQPYCIPKEIIIDPPKRKLYKIAKMQRGVIRSHKYYPNNQKTPLQPRTIRIYVRPSYTLYMDLFRPDGCLNKTDITLKRVKNGKRRLIGEVFGRKHSFHSNDTDYVELTVRKSNPGSSCPGGFILPFSSYRTESVAELMEWPKSSFSIIKDLEWIFEVRAVIEHCMVDSTGKAILICEDDEIIYSPEFSVAGYTRYQPACIFANYPCGGHTPSTLVQRNSCYWKSTCPVTWNGYIPILVSKAQNCIGHAASVIGLYGHRCVPKDQVFDMCNNCSKTINTDWGIIRSHPNYPWFFNSDVKYSKRIIEIGSGNKLLVIVQDMNLDPDGRDKFSLVHKYLDGDRTEGNEFPVIRQERRIVMKTKRARSGVTVEVSGGTLDVNFRAYHNTKGGRGFVLVFKRYKIDTPKTFSNKTEPPSDSVLFSDAAKPVRLKLNRRRCSGRGKRRRRGRACRARVWTDYFTQLE